MTEESEWTLVAEFTAETNLVAACRQLDYRKIRYQLRRDTGQQLWVADPEQVDTVLRILSLVIAAPAESRQSLSLQQNLRTFPVVCATIILGLIGALLVGYQFPLVHWFTFQDYVINGPQIGFYSAEEALAKGEYWRLLTPAFLHFGIFHVAFNSLWLWELGRRIERLAGSPQMLAIFLLTAVGSNIAQYWWDGPSLFGGLSGVVYGLLGYLWIRHQFSPHPLTRLPPGILGFMLFWLVICMTGAVEALLGSGVANAAHTGGLLIGMVLGGFAGLVARPRPGSNS